jgi:hypothetical protein
LPSGSKPLGWMDTNKRELAKSIICAPRIMVSINLEMKGIVPKEKLH